MMMNNISKYHTRLYESLPSFHCSPLVFVCWAESLLAGICCLLSPPLSIGWRVGGLHCNQLEWQLWILDKILSSKVWTNICFVINFGRDHWGDTENTYSSRSQCSNFYKWKRKFASVRENSKESSNWEKKCWPRKEAKERGSSFLWYFSIQYCKFIFIFPKYNIATLCQNTKYNSCTKNSTSCGWIACQDK